uniref:Lipocalin/cytosolic fatty-acid binding domain-containing protein n=1 Tax=Neogobius melanostomus TaxID=47308 RepID=A0A8C6TC35_9GOBI
SLNEETHSSPFVQRHSALVAIDHFFSVCISLQYIGIAKSPGVIGVFNRELLSVHAKVKDPEEPAKHSPDPYWVLSSEYQGHSLVYGCQDFGLSQLAWILSRQPTIPDETLEELLSILTATGVDVSKMVATNQDRNYCSPMEE